MKNALFFTGLIWLIFWNSIPGIAQINKDTVRLPPIQIDGRRWQGNYNETSSKIDSITLEKSITVRLSELLSQNTPIFIKEYGRGAMASASFRGTAPSHTKITWNGLEINSPMLGMVDFSLIPVYFTDEVKLLHGSSSLSESSGALGGTIQLENKPDWKNTRSGRLITGIGSFNTYDEYLQLNFGNRKVQSKSAIFFNSSSNDFPFINKLNASIDPETGGYIYKREKNQNADYLNYGFLEEFYLVTAPDQNLSLKTWLQHNDRSIPQLQTNESNAAANLNRQSENALRTVAEWKRFWARSKLSVMSALNHQNSVYSLENRVSGAENQRVIDAEASIYSFINKISFRHQFAVALTCETGIEADWYKVDSRNRLILGQSAGYNRNRFQNSLFAELEARLSPTIVTAFLLRESTIDFKQEALLPLFSLSYRPDPVKPLIVKGSIAFNSHPPTLNDLYYFPGGNPELKAENGTQLDFDASNHFAIGKSTLQAGLSVFHSNINNWIIWLPTFQGYWEPFNLDRVETTGAEANIQFDGTYRVVRYNIKANYNFTSTLNQSESSPAFGNQLPYIPRNSANLNVHAEVALIYFDWMWNYYSKRYTTTANSSETISDYLYPYIMNNLQVGIHFPLTKNRLKAEFKILNIFNEQYRTVLQRPMPGRNFQIILSYGF